MSAMPGNLAVSAGSGRGETRYAGARMHGVDPQRALVRAGGEAEVRDERRGPLARCDDLQEGALAQLAAGEHVRADDSGHGAGRPSGVSTVAGAGQCHHRQQSGRAGDGDDRDAGGRGDTERHAVPPVLVAGYWAFPGCAVPGRNGSTVRTSVPLSWLAQMVRRWPMKVACCWPGRLTRRPAAVTGLHFAAGRSATSARRSQMCAAWAAASTMAVGASLRSTVAAAPTCLPVLPAAIVTCGKPASTHLAEPALVKSIGRYEVPAATPAEPASSLILNCEIRHGATAAVGVPSARGELAASRP